MILCLYNTLAVSGHIIKGGILISQLDLESRKQLLKFSIYLLDVLDSICFVESCDLVINDLLQNCV